MAFSGDLGNRRRRQLDEDNVDTGLCIPGLGESRPRGPEMTMNTMFGVVCDAFSNNLPPLPSEVDAERRRRQEEERRQRERLEQGGRPARRAPPGSAADSSQLQSALWAIGNDENTEDNTEEMRPVAVEEELCTMSLVDAKGATPFNLVNEDVVDDTGYDGIVIRNGTVVNDDHVVQADVLIQQGIITKVEPSIDIEPDANIRIINASNKLVIPGGVDLATSLISTKNTGSSNNKDDLESGTKAGLFGGTTTVVDLINPLDTENVVEAVQRAKLQVEENLGGCDTALKVLLDAKEYNESKGNEMAEVAKKEGINIIHLNNFESTFDLAPFIKMCKDLGVLVEIDPNQSTLALNKKLGNEAIEETSTVDICALISQLNGAAIIGPMTNIKALEALERCRDVDKAVVIGSTSALALFKEAELSKKLMSEGLQMINSYHGLNEKFGIEQRLSLVFTKLKENFDLEEHKLWSRFVALTSSNAAKLANIYPRKGRIAVNSDADIVLWEVIEENKDESIDVRVISSRTHHSKIDSNPMEGLKIQGIANTVIAKGKIVIDDERATADLDCVNGENLELKSFAPQIFDAVQDRQKSINVRGVQREDNEEEELDDKGTEREEGNEEISMPDLANLQKVSRKSVSQAHQVVMNESLGVYQRPLSSHGVRNQQDSTFSLVSDGQRPDKRASIKVNAPPGGAGRNTSFW